MREANFGECGSFDDVPELFIKGLSGYAGIEDEPPKFKFAREFSCGGHQGGAGAATLVFDRHRNRAHTRFMVADRCQHGAAGKLIVDPGGEVTLRQSFSSELCTIKLEAQGYAQNLFPESSTSPKIRA